jgi:quercetin dioxygenase-like cupin family protein
MTQQLVSAGPGEQQTFWFLNNRTTLKIDGDATGGAYGMIESIVPPGYSPPLHVHHLEDEAFYVLEGRFTFRFGDETISGGPGTYVFLPRDVPHTFRVDGDEPGRLLTLISPGGGEQFFVEMGRPAAHEGMPPDEPIDIERLRETSARYGVDIVGPPLAA